MNDVDKWDDIVEQFESAWRHEAPPDLIAFLQNLGHAIPASTDPVSTDPASADLLERLIRVDLEHRWRKTPSEIGLSGANRLPDRPQIEDYVRAAIGFQSVDDVSDDLVSEEYRVRHQYGDRPRYSEFVTRFPDRADRLAWRLLRVHEVLREDRQRSGAAGAQDSTGLFSESSLLSTMLPSGMESGSESSAPRTRRGMEGVAESIGRNAIPGYELLKQLGVGGMGVVFHARQIAANRVVALKLIRPDRLAALTPAAQAEMVARFRTEIRAAASLEHENVVVVHEVGAAVAGPYYTMRYVEGESLADRIKQSPLTAHDAARYIMQAAHAIEHAHERGITHRDLKPANILIDGGTDRALVADFGLAKLMQVDGESLTGSDGGIRGTPAFMSPEQVRDFSSAGASTDIYALGAVLYCCLTGRPPFQAASPLETLRYVLEADLVLPRVLNPGIDRDLETVCIKCLEKATRDRYATARDLADDLQRYLAGDPIKARRLSIAERAWRTAKRHKAWAASLAAIVLISMMAALAIVETNARTRSQSLVERLWSSSPGDLPELLRTMTPLAARVTPQLRDAASSASRDDGGDSIGNNDHDNDRKREHALRAAIALQSFGIDQSGVLIEGLSTCSPTLIPVILDVLKEEHAARSSEILQTAESRLTAANGPTLAYLSLLAAFDPQSARWETLAADVVRRLEGENSFVVKGVWLETLRPAAAQMRTALVARYVDKERVERQELFAQIIADWYRNDSWALAEFALVAQPADYPLVADSLRRASADSAGLEYLRQLASGDMAADSQRRANAIALAFSLGLVHLEQLETHLQTTADPELRHYLIHRLDDTLLSLDRMTQLLEQSPQDSVRYAWLLAIGRTVDRPSDDLAANVLRIFRTDPSRAVHSAAEWTLRKWRLEDSLRASLSEREKLGTSKGPATTSEWYVTRQGHTMLILEPAEFVKGSPTTEPGRFEWEQSEPVVLERPFSIASTEVTVEQYLRFKPNAIAAEFQEPFTSQFPDPQSPMGAVSWFDAVAYCTWLNQQERIPRDQWCYLPTADSGTRRVVEWTLADDYLNRTGYRLPTDSEWEYACRAGTKSARFFGDSPALLPHYAWYGRMDRVHPAVGTKMPNEFGLFDVYGGVWEWCSTFVVDGRRTDFHAMPLRTQTVVLRSEPVDRGERMMRSAMWNRQDDPRSVKLGFGFRIARTEIATPEPPGNELAGTPYRAVGAPSEDDSGTQSGQDN